MGVLTIEEARRYARDWESPDSDMALYIDFAEEYIKSAISPGVDMSSSRVKLLMGMFVTDVDENRGTSAAENNTRSFLVTSLITQLRAQYGGTKGE